MHTIQLDLNHLVDAGLPGAFVYIEDANGRSQFYTAGFADLETRRRMTPESRYRIGSMTKTFTAVVLLQLVVFQKEGRSYKLEPILLIKRNLLHGHLYPIQMASFPS